MTIIKGQSQTFLVYNLFVNSPLFSVVIPTYNCKELLKKAVKSVLDQTYSNYEIIIIDNYSNDGTDVFVESLKNKKIKFVKTKNEGCIGRSRNIGIKLSRSKWIAFLDSDDIWFENRLKAVFNIFEIEGERKFDVICNNEIFIRNGKKILWKCGPKKRELYKNLIRYGNCISTSATVVKKDFLTKNKILFSENIEFSPYEDFEFWMRIASLGGKFKFDNNAYGEHLFHSASFSAQSGKARKESIISILRLHIFEVQNFTIKKDALWSHVENRLLIDGAIELFLSRRYLNSVFLFFKILLRHPIKSIVNILYKIK